MDSQVYVTVAIFVLAAIPQQASGCTDQTGCYCFDGFVTCFGITKFPTSFPENTTTLRVSNMTVQELPVDVFQKLPFLVAMEITDSNIGRLAPNTFRDMSEVDLINFRDVDIGTIDSYAFNNLIDIGTISLYMSTVHTIHEHAFANIFALDELSIFSVNITTIETEAFYDIDEVLNFNFYSNNVVTMAAHAVAELKNMDTLNMYLNTFGMLGCGVVEPLITNSRQSSFYSNSAPCDCRLSWVLDNARLHDHLFSNWCRVRGANDKVYFSDLTTEALFCDLDPNTGCPDVTMTTHSPVPTSPTKHHTTDSGLKQKTTKLLPIQDKARISTAETVVKSTPESSAMENNFQNDYPAEVNTPNDDHQATHLHIKQTNKPKETTTPYTPPETTTNEDLVAVQSAVVVSGDKKSANADDRRHKPTRTGHKKRANGALHAQETAHTTAASVGKSMTSENTAHARNGTNPPTQHTQTTSDYPSSVTGRMKETVSEKLGVIYIPESLSGAMTVRSSVAVMVIHLVTMVALLPVH